MLKKTILLALVTGTVILYSCSKEEEKTPTPEPTLYSKLGGDTLISDTKNPGQMIEKGRFNLRSVVDSSIFVIAADDAMKPYFATLLGEVTSGNTSNIAVLSKSLTDFFCVATGAKNFTYGGKDMKTAHDPTAQNSRMGLKADNAAFDKFVGDVVIGAQQNKVSTQIINEVGALLETTRADVVQR